MLSKAGYATGIFGKWHLGDNHPLRAMDHGFQESLVLTGGGLRQPGWPPNNPYFDPVLFRNGKEEKQSGYCMDVYTDAAMKFIESCRARPFFCYLATNLPHEPLEVPETYVAPYTAMGLDEKTAKVYGMIASIDENVGRLLAKLKELDLERDTIVVFMTDNGAAGKRFSAGLRAGKGTVYDGGIRVPLFIRWPARLQAGRKVDRIAAHVDLVPTLLDACGAAAPADVKLDGLDLLPLLDGRAGDWPERTLYFQWHRGDVPQMYRDAAARADRYKLVMHLQKEKPVFELYDMAADPGEAADVAAAHPDVVQKMRRGYEEWFKDVSATRGYDPPRIYLGAAEEDPTILSRQDWRGPRAGWAKDSLGYWEVDVRRAGAYEIRLQFAPAAGEREARLKMGAVEARSNVVAGADSCTLGRIKLDAGPGRLEAWLDSGGQTVGVQYVHVKCAE
jgi:arylsulfatase A-like enzyme